ncbi:MAG: hypothetical protein BWY22_00587 [Bacteroidetes bacterium ADurb.Bin217]|nr:MAG: hypothetical protein BWY22_00587 [Bacteroidetes bacterium ADurb.Bin217]
MKKVISYTSIALIGLSMLACSPKKDKTEEIANNVSHITIDQVLNKMVKYNTTYDIDSNEYKTVAIGKYEWFAQNLRVTKLNDGTPILNITDNATWGKTKEPAYASYNNEKVNEVNGLLYNHKTVATQKICPEGWQVANDSVWTNLIKTVKGEEKAAIALKCSKVWGEEQEATNETGFSAVPAGFRERDGKFHIMGQNAIWWSATEHNENNGMYYFIDKNSSLNHSHIERTVGLNIRCVKEIK